MIYYAIPYSKSCNWPAYIDDASSGNEVPIATIVTPIINSEIPNFLAISEELSTKKSEPFTKNRNPIIKVINVNIIEINYQTHMIYYAIPYSKSCNWPATLLL